MLYHIALVSEIHQHESAISVHMPPPSGPPFHLPPQPTPLGCHRVSGLSSLHHTADSHWLSILHTIMCMFQCYSLNSSHALFPSLCQQVCSLCLHLHCCPASRSLSTIFLDSIYIYMLIDNICFSLFDLFHSV